MLFPPINPGLDRWTLVEIAERGELVFECGKCWHVSMMDVPKFVGELGGDALVRDVLRQSVCRKCGRKHARARSSAFEASVATKHGGRLPGVRDGSSTFRACLQLCGR